MFLYIYILDAIEAYGLNCSKHSYQGVQESLIPYFLSGIPFPLPFIPYHRFLIFIPYPLIPVPPSNNPRPWTLIPCPLSLVPYSHRLSLFLCPLSLIPYPLKPVGGNKYLHPLHAYFKIRIDWSSQVEMHEKEDHLIKKSFEILMENQTKTTKIECRGVPGALWAGPEAPRSIFERFWVATWGQVGSKLKPSWLQNRIHSGMVFRSSFWIGCQSILGWISNTFWDPKWSPRVNLRQEVQNL